MREELTVPAPVDTAAIEFTKTPFVPASTPKKIRSVRFFAHVVGGDRTRGDLSRLREEPVSDAAAHAHAEWDFRRANGDDG